jgi:dienelactone hydrolase
MTSVGFQRLRDRVVALSDEQRHAEAYALATEVGRQFPDDEGDVYYLRSCAASRLGNVELATALIREALERGHWYGEAMLRHSPAWAPLQGRSAFEDVVRASIEAQQRDNLRPQHLLTYPPARTAPYRAVIALHGNGGNAAQSIAAWRGVVDDGWLLAGLSSSQWIARDRAVWDDEDRARRDIRNQYATVAAAEQLDPEHLVVAGFSMGAETGLRLALSGDVPAAGFVGLAMAGPRTGDPQAWTPLVEQWRRHGRPLRAYLLVGAHDDNGVRADKHRRLTEFLVDRGIASGLEILPNLGHAYPEDFQPVIRRALAFVDP